MNVLILYGSIPDSIYPKFNSQPDGSVAENWIETSDGDTILNHADYFGYNSSGTPVDQSLIRTDGPAAENIIYGDLYWVANGEGALPNLMDIPDISLFVWSHTGMIVDNIPMVVTEDGVTLTPSLVNFETNRPLRLNQLQGEWFAEKIFASATGVLATYADPVIVRDGNRGRLAFVHQTSEQEDPKGEVAAEIIINYLLAEATAEEPVADEEPEHHTPFEGLTISDDGTVSLIVGNATMAAGPGRCVFFDGSSLNGVRFDVHDFFWAYRADDNSDFRAIEGTSSDKGICGYKALTDPGQYRVFLDFSMNGNRHNAVSQNSIEIK